MNTSMSRYDDRPTLAKASRICSWFVGIVMLIAVIIYASIRGYSAHHHDPSLTSKWVSQNVINFPAVTICALIPNVTIYPLECEKEEAHAETADCLSYAKNSTFVFEGVQVPCFTFNEPKDSSNVISSGSSGDEMSIRVYVNASQVPEEEPIGTLLMLHEQGEEIELEEDSSWIIDVGKNTDIWLQKSILTKTDGSKDVEWVGVASAATIQVANETDEDFAIDVDFIFIEQGYWKQNEYYAYTVHNWIGEVGGLSCLLLLLHGLVVFIFMEIGALIFKKETPRERLTDN